MLAGGAAYLMREPLRQFFDERGFAPRLSFAWEHQEALTQLVKTQLPEAAELPSLPMRMTDGFGLFQALLGDVNRLGGRA